MFYNIGEKIKKSAEIFCWVGIISCIIAAICMFVSASDAYRDEETFFICWGFFLLFLGPLLSLVGSFTLYGFGELVERVCIIEYYLNPQNSQNKSKTYSNADTQKIKTLKELLANALITEEEYNNAMKNI